MALSRNFFLNHVVIGLILYYYTRIPKISPSNGLLISFALSTGLMAADAQARARVTAGPRSPEWTAKYGGLIVSGYEISTGDGMNEAGLNANPL